MKKDTIKRLIQWTIKIIVAYLFIIHGIKALLQDQVMLSYFTYFGFSLGLSIVLLILVGILDLIVAGFVLFKPKKFIVIWAIIWPIVPTIMEQLLTSDKISHFVSHLIQHTLPGVALYIVMFTPLIEKIIKKFWGKK